MMPDISIIVPMYNVEKYLPKCVDSLLNQTHRNIEIILVDDESPDRCGELADEYAKKDDRIKVIHQKNKWLGGARNSGLKVATGDYIVFVDSDDYIRIDMCEKLMSCVRKNPVDMVIFDIFHVNQAGEITLTSSAPIKSNCVFAGKEAQDILYPIIIGSHAINSACMKMYRHGLFKENELWFDEKIRYAEDYEFCLRLFPCILSFIHLNEPFYYYIENDTSIMHVQDKDIIEKFVVLYDLREQFLKKYHLDNSQNECKSAELLISMITKNLHRYLGDRKRISIKDAKSEIARIFNNPKIMDALGKIKVSQMDMGRYGRTIVWALRHKMPGIVYLVFCIGSR